jgi:hypothetical protein
MRKFIAILLTAALMLTLTACGGSEEPDNQERRDRTTTTTTADNSDNNTPEITTAPEPEPQTELIQTNPYVDLTLNQTVTIGTNFDDNSPMSWKVIDVDETNNRALLLATSPIASDIGYLSSTAVMTTEDMSTLTPNAIPWGDTWLRGFLNDDVFNSSFTDDERDFILKSTVTSQECRFFSQDRPGCLSSEDYLFVLSLEEIEQYVSNFRDTNTSRFAEGLGFFVPKNNTRTAIEQVPAYINNPESALSISQLSDANLLLIGALGEGTIIPNTPYQYGDSAAGGVSSLTLAATQNNNFNAVANSWVRVDVSALEVTETTVSSWSWTFGGATTTQPAYTFTSTNRFGSIVMTNRTGTADGVNIVVPFNNVSWSPLKDSRNAQTPNATPAMWVDIAPRYIEVEVTAAPSAASDIGSGESVPGNLPADAPTDCPDCSSELVITDNQNGSLILECHSCWSYGRTFRVSDRDTGGLSIDQAQGLIDIDLAIGSCEACGDDIDLNFVTSSNATRYIGSTCKVCNRNATPYQIFLDVVENNRANSR